MSEFPVEGERWIGVDTTTGRWDGGRHYVVICEPCGYRSPQLSRPKAYEAAREHAETRQHWMLRNTIRPRPKRLTPNHWAELREDDPYLRLNHNRDYDRLDAEAIAAGYEADEGAFRPWYRRHVMGLIALTADGDAFAVMNRLNEIAEAQKEVAGLTEALREWLTVTELIASVRGDV